MHLTTEDPHPLAQASPLSIRARPLPQSCVVINTHWLHEHPRPPRYHFVVEGCLTLGETSAKQPCLQPRGCGNQLVYVLDSGMYVLVLAVGYEGDDVEVE